MSNINLFEYVHNITCRFIDLKEKGASIWCLFKHVYYAKQKSVNHRYSGNQIEEILQNLPEPFQTLTLSLTDLRWRKKIRKAAVRTATIVFSNRIMCTSVTTCTTSPLSRDGIPLIFQIKVE